MYNQEEIDMDEFNHTFDLSVQKREIDHGDKIELLTGFSLRAHTRIASHFVGSVRVIDHVDILEVVLDGKQLPLLFVEYYMINIEEALDICMFEKGWALQLKSFSKFVTIKHPQQ